MPPNNMTVRITFVAFVAPLLGSSAIITGIRQTNSDLTFNIKYTQVYEQSDEPYTPAPSSHGTHLPLDPRGCYCPQEASDDIQSPHGRQKTISVTLRFKV